MKSPYLERIGKNFEVKWILNVFKMKLTSFLLIKLLGIWIQKEDNFFIGINYEIYSNYCSQINIDMK